MWSSQSQLLYASRTTLNLSAQGGRTREEGYCLSRRMVAIQPAQPAPAWPNSRTSASLAE